MLKMVELGEVIRFKQFLDVVSGVSPKGVLMVYADNKRIAVGRAAVIKIETKVLSGGDIYNDYFVNEIGFISSGVFEINLTRDNNG